MVKINKLFSVVRVKRRRKVLLRRATSPLIRMKLLPALFPSSRLLATYHVVSCRLDADVNADGKLDPKHLLLPSCKLLKTCQA